MLVGSHAALARSENTAHGAQMMWRKADGEWGQRGGGPFCLAFKSLFGCCLIPCDLIPANNWICTMKELWDCESVQLFLQVLGNFFNCFFQITDEHKFDWCSNTFLHKQTTDEYINQELARRQGWGVCFISFGSRLESSHAADVFLLWVWPSCHI